MAICRIYLLTYRRNHLLPRALNSLLQQSMTDWICEVHNDDPTDPFPRELVASISDSRIIMVDHAENLGATRTFNLVFQSVPEPFVSLLEDDNWWEPDFLETLLAAMNQYPDVQVAWANMRLWKEDLDGTWNDTEQTVWLEADSTRLFDWGQFQQIRGALHSNGAMMVRSHSAEQYTIPETTPFALTEPVRERAFHFPILLVSQVCANFAVTQSTARTDQLTAWAQVQTLLTASFFRHTKADSSFMQQVWNDARSKPARSTNGLFFAAFVCQDCRQLLDYATLNDWLFLFASSLKHPLETIRNLRAIEVHPKLWKFLNQRTDQRMQERDTSTSHFISSAK
ncbi:MAG: glycosyltransferase family 2 protein [Plectolyngbya sp. WJT66-NPBG17]|jgi:hypothetical protein|nr:glycosyltransferase family 2 protein [Plectolyngbya sp. WJT66-NPBG17]